MTAIVCCFTDRILVTYKLLREKEKEGLIFSLKILLSHHDNCYTALFSVINRATVAA